MLNNIVKVDARAKVLGQAKYAGDYKFPDMFHVKLIRCYEAHAKILELDFSRLKGTEAIILTARDIPNNAHGNILHDMPVLAEDVVKYYGEPVAIVAAKSRAEAEVWASMVKIRTEKLAVLGTMAEALQGKAIIKGEENNLLGHLKLSKGDLGAGFQVSQLVLEENFVIPALEHAYMEPEAATSWLEPDGILHIVASTQSPFADKLELARVFGISAEKVHVFAPSVGGAFGGKDGLTAQPYVAAVSLKTGKPAQLVYGREESLVCSFKRHGAQVKGRLGVDKHGQILAYDCEFRFDTGAYAGLGPAVLALAFEHSTGPYEIKNLRIDGKLIRTNKVSASAFRGFGAPQVLLAIETLLNRAAGKLGLSGLEIRKRNALKQESVGTFDQKFNCHVGFLDTLEAMQTSKLWQEAMENQDLTIGYGLASGFLSCGLGRGLVDQALVKITELEDPEHKLRPKYRVAVGTVDYGQGTATLFTQLAAKALWVECEQVEVIMGNTLLTQDCGSTAASRTGMVCGQAVLAAAQDLLSKSGTGRVGIGKAIFPEVEASSLKPEFRGYFGLPHSVFTFMTQLVKIKLMPKTLVWEVQAIHTCLDVGQVLHQSNFEGQVQGGIVMGLGGCLSEELTYYQGIPAEQSFTTYLVPTIGDLPKITIQSVASYEPNGPYGLKGMAEASSVAVAPAVLQALESCLYQIGQPKTLAKLPFTPTNLLT